MRILTEHPASVGQSYSEHFVFATSVGGNMVLAGLACMIHGLLPFLFETTGSRTIARLHKIMLSKRSRSYNLQWETEKAASQRALIIRPYPSS
jgi:Family of unknown function (DUF6356)